MKKLTLFCLLFLIFSSTSFGAEIYITQNTSGGDTGANCANAHSASWFNSNAVGGNIYHLCGTFTGTAGQTMFTPPSGTAGNPVVMRFEQGAVLTAPYWGGSFDGSINIINKSYITIDGDYTGSTPCGYVGSGANGTRVTCNGQILNTANGSPANSCDTSWPGYTYHAYSNGIVISNATNIEVRNLKISGIYMNDGSLSCATDASAKGYTAGVSLGGTLGNISIHNNELASGHMGISSSMSSVTGPINIYNNYIHDHGWQMALGSISTSPVTTVYVHDNEMTDWTNWQYPTSTYHTDGIIASCLQNASGPGFSPQIYNNYSHGDLGSGSATAHIFCTYAYGTGYGTGCIIFNNTIQFSVANGTGIWIGGLSKNTQIYNNTIRGASGANAGWGIGLDGTGAIIKNNTIDTFSYAMVNDGGSATKTVISQSDYNNFYNIGGGSSTLFSDTKNYTLSSWRSTYGFDTHSIAANPNLSANFVPNAGSSLIDAGTSLSSVGITALHSDPNGTSRPQGAGWDIGAYEYSAGGTTYTGSVNLGVIGGIKQPTLRGAGVTAESN